MLHRMVFACSLVLRNIGIMWSLFLRICESLRGGLKVFSRSHHLVILGYQKDGVFVQVPLVQGAAGDVDRREVVQVSAKFFCQSMNFLRFSTLFVILPSEHDGVVTVPSCSSFGIFAFRWSFWH